MTMFCEGCPNQGKMQGNIDRVAISDKIPMIGTGMVIVCDESFNPAVPFRAIAGAGDTNTEMAEFIDRAIALCDGPVTETQGRFRRHQVITGCGSIALQAMEIKGKPIRDNLQKTLDDAMAILRVKKGISE